MANIYDKASLVMIPSGTKTSKIFSQKPVNGDGDFTFSRSTSATRVNADGNIEKETQNLLTYSNDFSQWTFGGVTRTGGQSGYDGSNNAWLITATNVSGVNVNQIVNTSEVKTYSIYAKAGTTNWIRMSFNDTGINSRAWFDLTNGVVGTIIGNVIDTEITSLGSGWYRCSISVNLSVNSSSLYLFVVDGNGVTSASVGDSVYIQDAQLEQSLVARDYIETTTAAVEGGITDNVPRLDYTDSSCPALLLEPQRTNLIKYSEAIEFGITTNECTQTITNQTNPSGNDVSYLASAISSVSNQMRYHVSGLSSGSYFVSLFVKGDGNANTIRLRGTGGGVSVGNVYWNVAADGTITFDSPSGINAITESYGNGWYRIGYEETYDGASTSRFSIYPSNGDVNASTYVWGIQWEAGSYPTSYIPTYGTSVTRNEDTYKKLGFGNTSTEGTFYAEFEVKKIESANGQYMYGLSVGTTDLGNFYAATSGALSIIANGPNIQGFNNGYNDSLFSYTPSIGDTAKIAIRYDGSNVVAFVNGVKQTTKTDNASGVKNSIRVNHGEKSSHATKQLLFIPTALTDQEAIDLTTI